MGDFRVLKDELELGVPIKYAMLQAGYSFDEIESYEDSPEIIELIERTTALFISKHLQRLNSDDRSQVSQWLLERRVPKDFSQGQKIIDPPKMPNVIKIEGIYADKDEE